MATVRTPISSQPGLQQRPMESYSLKVATGTDIKYATYIASPEDITCLILDANKFKPNQNSILTNKDIFIAFKGTSTLQELKHDALAQIPGTDLGKLVASIGIKINGENNIVTSSFVKRIVNIWTTLMDAIITHIKQDTNRIFICGQSLGGAYSQLFGYILAEGIVSKTVPDIIYNNIKRIHIVTFGAPTTLADNARNNFNKHLDSELVTFDRLVSQAVPSIFSGTQAIVGGIVGPNDLFPNVPIGYSHAGWKPLVTDIRPEANGRPYSINYVRQFYGVPSTTRYRDSLTWPFNDNINYADLSNITARAELSALIKNITNIDLPLTEIERPDIKIEELEKQDSTIPSQLGGIGEAKNIYSQQTATHIPNLLSIQGSKWASHFAHGEYLGMFYFGAFRLPGMKNPGFDKNTAIFTLYPSGVKINYANF